MTSLDECPKTRSELHITKLTASLIFNPQKVAFKMQS